MRMSLACLLLILLPCAARAVPVGDLYEAEVPVSDQTDQRRPGAIRAALGQVLIKLTGDRTAPGRPEFAPVLGESQRLVQQYLYRERVPVSADPALVTQPETLLWARFDERLLSQQLRGLGASIWGAERPGTLVWLVSEDAGGPFIVGQDSKPGFIAVLEDRARRRGIGLVFPLLDLEDSSRIRAADIGSADLPAITEASARYGADAVLAGKIVSPEPGIWEAEWHIYLAGETLDWNTRGEIADLALEELIDSLADTLAARYVIQSVAGVGTRVSITVAEINTNDQYAETLKYLRSLSSVTDVQVTQVAPGQVSFSVTAHGGEAAIVQAIALSRRLQPIANSGERIYRLLP